MREEELISLVKQKEAELKLLKDELNHIWQEKQNRVNERILQAKAGKGDFTGAELTYAAYAKCSCGAGYAYPKNIGIHGAWHCSAILTGNFEKGSKHDGELHFSFWSVKSEDQPSVNGATTRPK